MLKCRSAYWGGTVPNKRWAPHSILAELFAGEVGTKTKAARERQKRVEGTSLQEEKRRHLLRGTTKVTLHPFQ
jgi:hypothetical protein